MLPVQPYHGVVLQYHMGFCYHGVVLQYHMGFCYHGVVLQYHMGFCYRGVVLQYHMGFCYRGVVLQYHMGFCYHGVVLQYLLVTRSAGSSPHSTHHLLCLFTFTTYCSCPSNYTFACSMHTIRTYYFMYIHSAQFIAQKVNVGWCFNFTLDMQRKSSSRW